MLFKKNIIDINVIPTYRLKRDINLHIIIKNNYCYN